MTSVELFLPHQAADEEPSALEESKKNSAPITGAEFYDFKWSLGAEHKSLKFVELINYDRKSPKCSKTQYCVMCGKSDVAIPSQNKNVCKKCDSTFWWSKKLDVIFKFCKGCKNFFVLDEFQLKPTASKCDKCRKRGRENYSNKKNSKDTDLCISECDKVHPTDNQLLKRLSSDDSVNFKPLKCPKFCESVKDTISVTRRFESYNTNFINTPVVSQDSVSISESTIQKEDSSSSPEILSKNIAKNLFDKFVDAKNLTEKHSPNELPAVEIKNPSISNNSSFNKNEENYRNENQKGENKENNMRNIENSLKDIRNPVSSQNRLLTPRFHHLNDKNDKMSNDVYFCNSEKNESISENIGISKTSMKKNVGKEKELWEWDPVKNPLMHLALITERLINQ